MRRQVPTWLAIVLIIVVIIVIWAIYAWLWGRGKRRPVMENQPPYVGQLIIGHSGQVITP